MSKLVAMDGNTAVSHVAHATNEEIAKEVIQGKWGNGAARRKNLEGAGYNYNTIHRDNENKDDNILYYLKNTFGENVGDVQTDDKFFKKCL